LLHNPLEFYTIVLSNQFSLSTNLDWEGRGCEGLLGAQPVNVCNPVPDARKQPVRNLPDLVVSRMSGSAHRRLPIDPVTGLNKYLC